MKVDRKGDSTLIRPSDQKIIQKSIKDQLEFANIVMTSGLSQYEARAAQILTTYTSKQNSVPKDS